jgi:hypothetical protein
MSIWIRIRQKDANSDKQDPAPQNQCCGSGSGIWYLTDPWIRDPGGVKSQDTDPGWTTQIIFPFFGLKYLNSLMRIQDPGWQKFGSRINIPESATLNTKLRLYTYHCWDSLWGRRCSPDCRLWVRGGAGWWDRRRGRERPASAHDDDPPSRRSRRRCPTARQPQSRSLQGVNENINNRQKYIGNANTTNENEADFNKKMCRNY